MHTVHIHTNNIHAHKKCTFTHAIILVYNIHMVYLHTHNPHALSQYIYSHNTHILIYIHTSIHSLPLMVAYIHGPVRLCLLCGYRGIAWREC